MFIAAALSITVLAGGADVRGNVLTGNSPLANAVVYLEGGSDAAKPMKGVVVDQKGKTFVPHVTVITPGTAIRFPNNDTVYHNVFAHYDAARFDLGVYPRGAVKIRTFNKPGVVSLLCSIHSEMSAYVVIVDTPFFAVTASDGSFTIPSVPPGIYTLKVWHETGRGLTQRLTVGSTAQSITLRAVRQ